MDKLEWQILVYVKEHPGATEPSISEGVGHPGVCLYERLCNLIRMGYLKKHGFSYYKIRG